MRQSDAITALLARTDRSKGSSAAQLRARATRFREIQFAKGELVFARGDPGAHLYSIAIGRVRVAL
jgi:CRP-like cAMP-binding protein